MQSLKRAFLLLELLDRTERDGLPLGVLARSAGLKAPTARNLLTSLAELGYVRQDAESRHYFLGPRAFQLGLQRRAMDMLRTLAGPVLAQLRDATGETALLAVYDNGYRHTLVSAESGAAVRVGVNLGRDESFYPLPTGRVLLSQLPEEELGRLADRFGLPGRGVWPGAESVRGLRRELERIRRAGECRVERTAHHLLALAVPLGIEAGPVFGTLGLYYPLNRDAPGRADALIARLRGAADEVKRNFERSWPCMR